MSAASETPAAAPEAESRPRRGHRPKATSNAAIARVGLALFLERGFEDVTVKDIAAAVGVSVRTVFRYFPTKADIAWGAVERGMRIVEEMLDGFGPEISIREALVTTVIRNNTVREDDLDVHRERMRLILKDPALGGMSMTREPATRHLYARFVARRLGVGEDDMRPQTVARTLDAVTYSVYDRWLAHPEEDLETLFREAFAALGTFFDGA